MKSPLHPGKLVAKHLRAFKLTSSRAAALMDLSPEVIVKIVACQSKISAYVAIKLSLAFETTPEFWLNLQMKYDLHSIRKNIFIPKIQPFKRVPKIERLVMPRNERLKWMSKKGEKNFTSIVRRNYYDKKKQGRGDLDSEPYG